MPHITPFSGMIFLLIIAVGGVILAITATPMIRRNEGNWDKLFAAALGTSLISMIVLCITLYNHKDFFPHVLS